MTKLTVGTMVLAVALCASAEICVKDGDTVAFMGDSITEFGNYPAGYVNLVMKGLEVAGVRNAKKLPAGISGHKSNQMLARLDGQVLAKKPQWMTFSCGVNDVWHQDWKAGVLLPDFQKNVREIFDRCAASNVNVIVLTPTVIGEDLACEKNRKLKPYVDWIREEAARRKLPLADLNADFHAELARLRAAEPDKKGNRITCDGVHMAFPGNCVMAWGVLRAMGVDPAMKDKIFAAFRKMPQAYKIDVSFTADEWDAYQKRCKQAGRADCQNYARELLVGSPEAK